MQLAGILDIGGQVPLLSPEESPDAEDDEEEPKQLRSGAVVVPAVHEEEYSEDYGEKGKQDSGCAHRRIVTPRGIEPRFPA